MEGTIILSFFRKEGNDANFQDVTLLTGLVTIVEELVKRYNADFTSSDKKTTKEILKAKLSVKETSADYIRLFLTETISNNNLRDFYNFLSSPTRSSHRNPVLKETDNREDETPFSSYKDSLYGLGVEGIIISYDKNTYIWPENMQPPLGNISEIRYFNDLKNGLGNLNRIITKITQIINSSRKDCLYYGKPKYVFRGITRFYNDMGIGSEEKDIEKESKDVNEDYIKSSLAVRLRDTSKDYLKEGEFIRVSYINVLEDMIRKAKNMYPNNYPTDMSDLDVLADIQHNGGATGLVDFSKNILTSIWFACNADHKYNGYVYCYNIMEDMITNDALTYIRPEDENKSISELLALTIKETNVYSDVQTRFFIWEPSKRNNRIARQDSVFILGIGKFKISEHNIKVIEIPAEQKSSILTAMKAVFNISGNSVYSDYIGFANNLNKLRPYRKISDSAYSRGHTNMIRGHYSSALDFLKLAELEVLQSPGKNYPTGWNDRKVMELHFSLAICYKKLSKQNDSIKYLENAILEYQKVIELSTSITNMFKKSKEKHLFEGEKEYYRRKTIRAYNEIIDLQYKLQRYDEAMETCFNIIKDIHNNADNDNIKDNETFTSKYSELTILELISLTILKNRKEYDDNEYKYQISSLNEKISSSMSQSIIELFGYFKKCYCSDFDFFCLLEDYFYTVTIIIEPELTEEKINVEKQIITWRTEAERYFEKKGKEIKCKDKNDDKYKDYISWDFADIKREIDSIQNNNLLGVKSKLQDLTAEVISLRDLYEKHDWRNKTEI